MWNMARSIFRSEKFSFFLPASAIFIISLLIRTFYFITLKEFRVYPDSEEYLRAAYKLSSLMMDTARVPLYPAFIQLSRLVLPWTSATEAVYIFQMIVSSLGMVILFILCSMLFHSGIKAFFITVFCATNTAIINWDFLLLSESLSMVLLLFLVFILLLLLQKPVLSRIVLSFVLCGCLLFIRPFYALFPALLMIGFLFLFRLLYKQERRFIWASLAGAAVVYLAVLLYSNVNYHQNGYLGISPVSTINKMGKVLQYDMQDLSSNEKIKEWVRQEKTAARDEAVDPVVFMRKYGLEENFYQEAAEFTGEIIKNHPLIYIRETLGFIAGEEFLNSPVFTDYNQNNYNRLWPSELFYALNGFAQFNKFKFFLFLLFLECIHTVAALAAGKKDGWMWLVIDSILLYQLFMSVIGAHGEYQRLMAPAYPFIFIIFYRNIFVLFDGFKNSIKLKFSI